MGQSRQSQKRQQPQNFKKGRIRIDSKAQAKDQQKEGPAKVGRRSTLIEPRVKTVTQYGLGEDRNLSSDSDSSTLPIRHRSSKDTHEGLYTLDRPYRTLLQSLTGNSHRDGPIQKKRRLVTPPAIPPPITDVDAVEELNEAAESEYESTEGSEVDDTEN
ncbi:MAG: hypothetical protein Q9214_006921, partial [Letrouitia sp. 1 TL-2023]